MVVACGEDFEFVEKTHGDGEENEAVNAFVVV